jgi:hypothetical protein
MREILCKSNVIKFSASNNDNVASYTDIDSTCNSAKDHKESDKITTGMNNEQTGDFSKFLYAVLHKEPQMTTHC